MQPDSDFELLSVFETHPFRIELQYPTKET